MAAEPEINRRLLRARDAMDRDFPVPLPALRPRPNAALGFYTNTFELEVPEKLTDAVQVA